MGEKCGNSIERCTNLLLHGSGKGFTDQSGIPFRLAEMQVCDTGKQEVLTSAIYVTDRDLEFFGILSS